MATQSYNPYNLFLKPVFKLTHFPQNAKKVNVAPVHKKGDKQSLKNYCPISLLPTCGKIFERLQCNKMFEHFIENNLISHNQSQFKHKRFMN